MDELYAVEFSQYTEDQDGYPLHVGLLKTALEDNLEDFHYNTREENKYQIVFIGSMDECSSVADGLLEHVIKRQKLIKKLKTIGKRKASNKWLTISVCPPETTVYRWDTQEEAKQALEQIDKTGCGHLCIGSRGHSLVPPKFVPASR